MAISAVPVPLLLALLFCLGLISPVAAGVRNALTSSCCPAEAYIAGRSLFRIVAQSAQVVGNATGGLLIALTSPRGALAARLRRASSARSLVVRLATQARPPLAGDGGRRAARQPPARTRCRACRRCSPTGASGACCCSAGSCPTCAVAPESLAAPYVSRARALRRRRSAGGSPRFRRARSRASSWPSGSCPAPGGGGWSASLAGASFVPLLAVRRASRASRSRCLLLVISGPLQRLGARPGRADPRGHAREPARARVQRQQRRPDLPAGVRLRRRGRAGRGRRAARRDRDRRGDGPGRGRAPGAGHPRRAAARRGGIPLPRYSEVRAAPPGAAPIMSLRRTHLVLALVAALAAPARRRPRTRRSRSAATATATAWAWASTAPRATRCRAGRTSRSWRTTTRARRSGPRASPQVRVLLQEKLPVAAASAPAGLDGGRRGRHRDARHPGRRASSRCARTPAGFTLLDASGTVLARGWVGPVTLTATGGGPVTLAGAGAQLRARRPLSRAAARARRRRRPHGRQPRHARELPAAASSRARCPRTGSPRRSRRRPSRRAPTPWPRASPRRAPTTSTPTSAARSTAGSRPRSRRRRPPSRRPPGRSCSTRGSRSSRTSRRPPAGAPRPPRTSFPTQARCRTSSSVDDPYDTISPYHDWTLSLSDRELSQKAGYPGLVTGVQVDAFPSGRVNTVTLNGSAGPARALGRARAQAPRPALDLVHDHAGTAPAPKARAIRRSRCTRAWRATASCCPARRRPATATLQGGAGVRLARHRDARRSPTTARSRSGAPSARRSRYRLVAGSLSSAAVPVDAPLRARCCAGARARACSGRLYPVRRPRRRRPAARRRRPLDLGCAHNDDARRQLPLPRRAPTAGAGACAGAVRRNFLGRALARAARGRRARWPGRRPIRWPRASGTSPPSTPSPTPTRCRRSRTRPITVAVIDSGIDRTSPDLAGAVPLAPIDEAHDPTTSLVHGTAVAGIIAADADNGIGGARRGRALRQAARLPRGQRRRRRSRGRGAGDPRRRRCRRAA